MGSVGFLAVHRIRRFCNVEVTGSKPAAVASGCVRADSTKKNPFFFVGAGFLSLSSQVIFGTAHSWPVPQPAFGHSRRTMVGDTRSTKPDSFFVVLAKKTPVWRLEERPPFFS